MKKDKLHNVKSTGFKTPNTYFDSFEDKLFERLYEEKSIEGVKNSGYTVPKDYFDSVEDTILSKINTDETPVVRLNTKKAFYYIAGIAASLVIMLAVLFGNGSTEELSVEMVETYLENRDLDSYELAQLLSDVDLLEDDFTIATTPYEEDNLESYLLNNADIENILEQ